MGPEALHVIDSVAIKTCASNSLTALDGKSTRQSMINPIKVELEQADFSTVYRPCMQSEFRQCLTKDLKCKQAIQCDRYAMFKMKQV